MVHSFTNNESLSINFFFAQPSHHRVDTKMISRRRLQKIMTLPINLIFRYLQSGARVVIWLYDRSDLRIEGKILGFDEFMNLVLDEAEEIRLKAGTKRTVGRIMLKGDNISVITPAEVVASSSN